MKNNVCKKLIICALALSMAVSMAACGSKEPAPAASSSAASSSTASVSSEAPASESAPASEAADAGEVTEDSYKEELGRLFTEINEKSGALSSIDANDPAGAAKAIYAAIDEVGPLYMEMAEVEAPESLKDVHAAVAAGAPASVELLKVSAQMMEIAAGTSSADVAALQAKMAELTPTVTAFGEAIQTLIGE